MTRRRFVVSSWNWPDLQVHMDLKHLDTVAFAGHEMEARNATPFDVEHEKQAKPNAGAALVPWAIFRLTVNKHPLTLFPSSHPHVREAICIIIPSMLNVLWIGRHFLPRHLQA